MTIRRCTAALAALGDDASSELTMEPHVSTSLNGSITAAVPRTLSTRSRSRKGRTLSPAVKQKIADSQKNAGQFAQQKVAAKTVASAAA